MGQKTSVPGQECWVLEVGGFSFWGSEGRGERPGKGKPGEAGEKGNPLQSSNGKPGGDEGATKGGLYISGGKEVSPTEKNRLRR